jgi:hypothetical protein
MLSGPAKHKTLNWLGWSLKSLPLYSIKNLKISSSSVYPFIAMLEILLLEKNEEP